MTAPSRSRIDALIAAYGADPSRWPEPERALAAGADACVDPVLHEARALDALLAHAAETPPPAAGLRRAILAAVARDAQAPRGLALLRALWRELGGARFAAPAFAAALALGLGLGLWVERAGEQDTRSEDLLALMQFEDHYAEIDP